MKKSRRTLSLIIILLIFFSTMAVMFSIYLGKIRYVKIPKDDGNLGIKKEDTRNYDNNEKSDDKMDKKEEVKNDSLNNVQYSSEYNENIINIALLGGDRRKKGEVSHADAIIVLSIDNIHKKIKISSVMRDTYVKINGHGSTKLAHAYAYGGPPLTIRTLNENFGLGIRDYVYIDFNGFEKLVDSIGGVEIETKQYEIGEINKYIREVAYIKNVRPKLLKKPGLQVLNGQQALAYSRIRRVGNGDFTRTDRQRKVLSIIIEKINKKGLLEYPAIAANILPYVETSLSKTDIIKLGVHVLTWNTRIVEQRRFPKDGYCQGKMINEIWYLVTDIENTKKQMHRFIYEGKV